MMSMEIRGIEDAKKILEEIAPKRSLNLITATVRGVASEIAKEMKGNAPKNTKNLIKSIKVKKSRSDKFKPVFKVEFDSGKSKKHDGFYWRFVEHGTQTSRASNFVRRSRLKIESNMGFIIQSQFVKKLESQIKRELKKQAVLNK